VSFVVLINEFLTSCNNYCNVEWKRQEDKGDDWESNKFNDAVSVVCGLRAVILSKCAPAVTPVTCVLKEHLWNTCRDVLPVSVPPRIFPSSDLNWIMTAFPYILSISLFNTIYSCDTLQSELLTASLNELQTNKQNEMWYFGKLHFTCRKAGIRFLVRSFGIVLFTTAFTLILRLTPWIKELKKKLIWLALKFCLDTVQEKPRDHCILLGYCDFDACGTSVGLTYLNVNPPRKLSTNLYDIYHCWVYSDLMTDRGTVWNM